MKKYIIGIAVVLFIIIDLSVLLYPTISDYVNSRNQSRVVSGYLDDVAVKTGENTQAVLDEAHEYNESLRKKPNRFNVTEEETAEYKKKLDTGRGVMGIFVIDKIDVKLPIYHGSDEGVLQIGLGHMQGTSLPIGGTGTHAIITGHRGLPSSTLFTHLDKMAEGDSFTVFVMGETITYQVDNIQTVEPHEVQALDIDPDMDYCTLVTCTPYGINSHRLLVRGRRIENAAVNDWGALYSEARLLDKLMVIFIFIIPVMLVLIVYFIVKCRRIQKGGRIQK